jgi:uncharacterized protein (TIGR03435 family)
VKTNPRAYFGCIIIWLIMGSETLSQSNNSLPRSDSKVVVVGSYDVVSIRPNVTGETGIGFEVNDYGIHLTNVSLLMLLVNAYGLREGKIMGLPHWAASARFDIVAKVLIEGGNSVPKLTFSEQMSLVQGILIQRFHLKAHPGTKSLPGYQLVIAAGADKALRGHAAGTTPEELPAGMVLLNRGELRATAMSTELLAKTLSNILERDVSNKTGLIGKYDILLKWTPDSAENQSSEISEVPTLPSIYTALLGLRLVSINMPSAILVVDAVDRPSEN